MTGIATSQALEAAKNQCREILEHAPVATGMTPPLQAETTIRFLDSHAVTVPAVGTMHTRETIHSAQLMSSNAVIFTRLANMQARQQIPSWFATPLITSQHNQA